MIKYYAAHLEDANPSYWDEDFATQAWGGIVSPPGMLMSWLMPLPWKPQPGCRAFIGHAGSAARRYAH